MVRYRHPKHGYHIAGYGEDVAALEAAGWTRETPQAPATLPAPDPKDQRIPPPPVDNEHVAPGCEPFSDEVVAANAPPAVPAPSAPRRDGRPKRGR